MIKKERAKIVIKILEMLYPNPAISLNFIKGNVFSFLIAVLLSAQSTDKMVNRITPLLFKKADNPKSMSELSVESIRKIIKPIGLSKTKANNIHKLSKQLLDQFNGKVPNNFEDLENLAGVGHKTASVIMIQVFKKDAFPVDTHIHRLAKRWGLSNGKNVKQTEEDLKKIFPKEKWRNLHLQMIFFGREYCPAINHVKGKCPICSKLQ